MKFKMTELILIVILFSSAASAGFILFRKIPVLADLPKTAASPTTDIAVAVKKAASKVPFLNKFNYEFYLQKILSKVRILTLKTESKTGSWLERLRHKISQRNNGNHNDNYWDDLKK